MTTRIEKYLEGLVCYCVLLCLSGFRDGDHLGDEGVHLRSGSPGHSDGPHNTFHLWSLVSISVNLIFLVFKEYPVLTILMKYNIKYNT